jgi:hypothetical protein
MARAGARARVCPEDFMAPPAMSDVASRWPRAPADDDVNGYQIHCTTPLAGEAPSRGRRNAPAHENAHKTGPHMMATLR